MNGLPIPRKHIYYCIYPRALKSTRTSPTRHLARSSSTMFDHIAINVQDVPASKAFYTTLLAPLGYTCNFSLPEHNLYAFGPRFKPQFWLMPGRDVTRHSGPVHVAFSAWSRAEVDAFHAAGVKAGGKCNGPPGVRGEYH